MTYCCGNCEVTFTNITIQGMSLHNDTCGRSWRVMGWTGLEYVPGAMGPVYEPQYRNKAFFETKILPAVPTYTTWLSQRP